MRPHPAHCRHHNNPASPPQDIPRRQSWPPARPRATLTMVDRSPAARAPGALPGRSHHASAMARASRLGRPWAHTARVFTAAPAARCAVCLRMFGFSHARYAPKALCKDIWRHVSRVSRPSSGAHPAHGRPVCCRMRVVRTQPVSRPGRAAYLLARPPDRTRNGSESLTHARHPRKRGSAPPTARKRRSEGQGRPRSSATASRPASTPPTHTKPYEPA